MIATGFTIRSLANQDDISFNLSATFSNATGKCEFGFTGISGLNSHFTFESGKIYDFDNRYIWSYQQLNSISISGNIVDNKYNYFIDSIPVCLLGNRKSGYYSGFYISPTNVDVDFDLVVSSDAPQFSLHYPTNILTGQSITGYIFNEETIHNRAFRIFSGELFNQNILFSLSYLYTGTKINGLQSGMFVIDQTLSSNQTWQSTIGAYTIPLRLFTDFTTQITGLDITIEASPIFNIQFLEMFTGASGIDLNAGYAYVYQVLTQSTGDLNYCFELRKISGFNQLLTGQFDLSGEYSGSVTGFIQGTDYVYGYINALGLSPTGDYYGNPVSGIVPFFISELTDPTGIISYSYSLPATGLGTGYAPPGTLIHATGYITGMASAYIEQSGALTGIVSGLISGYYNGYLNSGITGVRATGFQWATGTFFIDYGNYAMSGLVSGEGATGFFGSIYKIGTGITVTIQNGSGTWFMQGGFTGIIVSGELRAEITPTMTSDTTPSGVASASSEAVFGEAYRAFDNASLGWRVTGGREGYIQFDFNAANPNMLCNAYEIVADNINSFTAPQSWALSGSNDGGNNWTYIDSRTGEIFIKNFQRKYYEFSNNNLYNILRLVVFSSTGASATLSTLAIQELNLLKRTRVTVFGSGFIPIMTSNTTPYGAVGWGAAQDDFTTRPWHAFDKNNTTFSRTFVGASGVPSGYSVRLKNNQVQFPNDNATLAIRGVTGDSNYNYWYGDFTNIFGSARSKYAVTDKTNTLQFDNLGLSNSVFHVALSGNTTYVGGSFVSFSGRDKIFALENNQILNPFEINAIGQDVFNICPNNNDVLIGVTISNSSNDYNSGIKGLIKANTSGIIDTGVKYSLYNLGSTGAVFDILNIGGLTYAVGNFQVANWYFTNSAGTGASGRFIAVTESENNTRLVFPDFTPSNSVNCSILDNSGNYIIGGRFTSVSGNSSWNRICKYNSGLKLQNSLQFDFNNTVRCFAISGDTLFVGGDFTTVNGFTRNRLCSINLAANNGSGELISGFAPSVSSTVYALDYDLSGNLFVGGAFTEINGNSRNRYAVLNQSGTLNPISHDFNNEIRAIKNIGDYVWCGGHFTSVDSITRNRLARLTKDGIVTSFNPNVNSTVSCIETGINNDVYIGGSFSFVSSSTRNSIAKFDSDLNLSTYNINLNTSLTLNVLKVNSNNDIYIGTSNSSFDRSGVPFSFSAAFDSNSNIKNWGISPNNSISTLCLNNNQIFAGGDWQNSIGIWRPYGAAFDSSGNVTPWNPKASNLIKTISTGESGIMLGGIFTVLGNSLRSGIGYVDYSGNNIDSFNASLRGQIYKIKNITGDIYIGGNIQTIGGIGTGAFLKINSENGTIPVQPPYFLTGNNNTIVDFYNDHAGSGIYVVSVTGYGQSNYLQFDMGAGNAHTITGYQIALGANFPSGWSLFASNNNSNFDILDRQPYNALFNSNFEQYYPVTGNSYRYYRIVFGDQPTVDIRELQLFETGRGVVSRIFNIPFSGTGYYTGNVSGNFTGLLGNITGFIPAFVNATGILTGFINDGSGTFTWSDIQVSKMPSGFVYLHYPIGTIDAVNDIIFLNSTGSGLNLGDTINITGNQYFFTNSNSPPFGFNSPENLANIFNSGATGAYGISFMRSLKVTGYMDNNILRLRATGNIGESGNRIKVSRDSFDPRAIVIPYRYFQSGQSFYPTSTTWTGAVFTGRHTITVENSGIFFSPLVSGQFYSINATTGIIWNDSFSGNFGVITGYLNDNYSPVPFIIANQSFSGCSIIPAASGDNYSGVNIVFIKPNPYNISGNIAQFNFTVNGQIISGGYIIA